jgi:hypothetical protein
MANPSWHKQAIWILKGNLIIWFINVIIFVLFVFSGTSVANLVSLSYFTKMTLLETGLAFLTAGAVAFSGSILPNKAKEHLFKTEKDQWSIGTLKNSEKRANQFIFLAIMLFFESIIISFLGL